MINSESKKSNTGYKGICYRNPEGRTAYYETQVAVRGKNSQYIKIYIGKFSTLQEALTQRQEFIKSLF